MFKFLYLFWIFITFDGQTSPCAGHFINPLKDICWDCIFPLTIGKAQMVAGDYPDTPNPSNLSCLCPTSTLPRLGISLGFWEPFALVDITRKPYCLVNLGTSLNIKGSEGGAQSPFVEGKGAFYYTHWYKYPVIYWLQLITCAGCMQIDNFDIAFMSELDPTWNDSKLSFILNPEAILFTSPEARISCSADATQVLQGTAIDSLFWCQGGLGSTYPLSGFIDNQVSPIAAALLETQRLNFKLHRLHLIRDSVGENAPKLCDTYPSSTMPKSRYRYQMVNTLADNRCHPFGQGVLGWELNHYEISAGDNYGFLIWRKRNCCFL